MKMFVEKELIKKQSTIKTIPEHIESKKSLEQQEDYDIPITAKDLKAFLDDLEERNVSLIKNIQVDE